MERGEYEVLARVERRHWWFTGMWRIAEALLARARPERSGGWQILDAGCGTGGNLLRLSRYGRVAGVDLSFDAANEAVRRAPGRVARATVERLPFRDGSFDLVTSFEVLYHLSVSDEFVALSEAFRVLRPGGWLLIRLPAFESLRRDHDRRVHTRRRYTRPEVRALLERSGFLVRRATYANGLLLPALLLRLRAERRRPSRSEAERRELDLPNPRLNAAMGLPLLLEAAFVRLGGSLPAGVSVFCLAEKPV